MSRRRYFSWCLRAAVLLAALACHAEPERVAVNQAERPEGAEDQAPCPAGCAGVSPASSDPEDISVDSGDAPEEILLAVLNRDRAEAPLRRDAQLEAVVQDYVDELARRGDFPSGDVSQALLERLNQSGYRAYRVVIGFAQLPDPFPVGLAAWRKSDPASFERLRHPELRDLAVAEGSLRGQPFYLVVGAVRQREHYEAESRDLRRDLEKTRQDELRRVNARRAEDGLPALQRHPSLDLAAQRYAEDMLARSFYGHLSPEGQDVGDRVRAARYPYRKVGENVASGQASVEAVMQGWIESPEHLHNLLDRDFRDIGIGFAAGPSRDGGYRFLWVQVFGQARR